MIDVTQRGDVAIVQMQHGKANAQDIEFCDRDRSSTPGTVRLRPRARSC